MNILLDRLNEVSDFSQLVAHLSNAINIFQQMIDDIDFLLTREDITVISNIHESKK